MALAHAHRVASLVQRWILGTHRGAVSHDELDYYLDEFTFASTAATHAIADLLFYRLLQGSLAADPHPQQGPHPPISRTARPSTQSGERTA